MRFMLVCVTCLLGTFVSNAHAASVSKIYHYYKIGGTTLEDIEKELDKRGPELETTGLRHPGATRLEFTTRVTYGQQGRRCRVVEASVHVDAEIILPHWKRRNKGDEETRLIWDILSADIKRHEEAHITIARNHAREIEEALILINNERDCDTAQTKAQDTTNTILAKHDREQARFDRIESSNFDSRLLRLLRYRLERMEAPN